MMQECGVPCLPTTSVTCHLLDFSWLGVLYSNLSPGLNSSSSWYHGYSILLGEHLLLCFQLLDFSNPATHEELCRYEIKPVIGITL